MRQFAAACWIVLCGVAGLATTTAQDLNSTSEIEAAARKILAEPEFRFFEHFSPDSPMRQRSPQSASSTPRADQQDSSTASRHQSRTRGESASSRDDSASSRDQASSAPQRPTSSSSETQPSPTSPSPSRTKSSPPADQIERPTRDRGRNRRIDTAAPEDTSTTSAKIPQWTFPFGSLMGGALQGLAYAVVAAVVILILLLIAKAAMSWESLPAANAVSIANANLLDDERSPGETDADVYVAAAQRLAGEGRYREAIGQLLLGAISQIERARWIRYRRGLTLRDYLRATRSSPSSRTALTTMIRHYEPASFGQRTATIDHYHDSLQSYEQGFRKQLP